MVDMEAGRSRLGKLEKRKMEKTVNNHLPGTGAHIKKKE